MKPINPSTPAGTTKPRRPRAKNRDATEPLAELETQEQIHQRFKAAIDAGVSPCAWIPPEWAKLEKKDGAKRFADNSADAGEFARADEARKATERLRKGEAILKIQPPEGAPTNDSWPHPMSDTGHIDETEFSAADYATIAALPDKKVVAKLGKFVGPAAPGMKRLARIFEWSLYRTTVLMDELNEGLATEEEYDQARTNYINFLRDLDDHEPEKGPKRTPDEQGKRGALGRPTELDPLTKESASGYGRAMKWTCIDPVIFGGKIVGTRVIIKWNPHLSSSGIAINH